MEVLEMTEKEQATSLMDKFIDLQRIKAAEDKDKEVDYQLKTTKAKLEALGIVTENLEIKGQQKLREAYKKGDTSFEVSPFFVNHPYNISISSFLAVRC